MNWIAEKNGRRSQCEVTPAVGSQRNPGGEGVGNFSGLMRRGKGRVCCCGWEGRGQLVVCENVWVAKGRGKLYHLIVRGVNENCEKQEREGAEIRTEQKGGGKNSVRPKGNGAL